ncbi:DUF1036 domain-containing protein [Phaeobacter porticola]|uniref:Putative integral membrane protein n=1 Tax=Phaeobacter porticola TaxID=1844006 RepID=A0A1L3I5Z7_9RHOB|nr:DUF1036 domain-containing protein [Phaeobacter porticola]APG47538.1 putative integral membrane protein [Phaeobacter porticola]
MCARLVLALLLAPLMTGAAAPMAQAAPAYIGLEVCNDTPVPQSVSLAYRDDGQWLTKGWWRLPPASCRQVLEGRLQNRFYYFRSTAPDWQFLDERISFCVGPDEFTIYGDHDCAIRGYKSAFFAKIDTHDLRGRGAETANNTGAQAFVSQLSAHSQPIAGPTTNGALAGIPDGRAVPPQGQYGPGFVSNVTFLGCEERGRDGQVICKFVTEDGQICVEENGMTSSAIIDRLQALAPGTPVQISGDRLGQFERITQAMLHDVKPRDETGLDALLYRLEGDWVSLDDDYDRFVITGAERRSFYGKIETSVELISVQGACGDASGQGPYLMAQAEDGGPVHCYRIMSVTETELDLSYLPRGTQLRYRRNDMPVN